MRYSSYLAQIMKMDFSKLSHFYVFHSVVFLAVFVFFLLIHFILFVILLVLYFYFVVFVVVVNFIFAKPSPSQPAHPHCEAEIALLSRPWRSTHPTYTLRPHRVVDLRPYRAIANSVGIVEHSRL